jgi:hypothetical protein
MLLLVAHISGPFTSFLHNNMLQKGMLNFDGYTTAGQPCWHNMAMSHERSTPTLTTTANLLYTAVTTLALRWSCSCFQH